MSSLSGSWPNRPDRFYDDWQAFCAEALSQIMRSKGGDDMTLATVLLGGGAVLGAGGLAKIINANRRIIDDKGKEWGIDNLSQLLTKGGLFVGAALGGLGGAWAHKLLEKMTDDSRVDRLQSDLNKARREFETLLQDRSSGGLTNDKHMAAVEYLFMRVVDRKKG